MIIQQALQQYVIGNFDRVVRHPEPERTLNVILDPKSSAVRAGPSTCFFPKTKSDPGAAAADEWSTQFHCPHDYWLARRPRSIKGEDCRILE